MVSCTLHIIYNIRTESAEICGRGGGEGGGQNACCTTVTYYCVGLLFTAAWYFVLGSAKRLCASMYNIDGQRNVFRFLQHFIAVG